MKTFDFNLSPRPHNPSATKKLAQTARAAALLALGVAALGAPARANYEQKAIEATDYTQRAFYDANAKLYRPTAPMKPDGLPYEVMWGNGLQHSVLTFATKYEPEKYKQILYDFSEAMQRYWDKDAPIPGFDAYFSSPTDDDKYYDDNAWLVLSFAEAYDVTKDQRFLGWAEQTQNFVLSGYDDKLGGGLYWHQQKKESKNTCVSGPAAAAALDLYRVTGDKTDLEQATQLYTWTNAHLQDKDGLYWDNINLNGEIGKAKFTYNTALMLRNNVELYKVTNDQKYLDEARRVADASLAYWTRAGGNFGDDPKFNNWLCEALLLTYQATDDVKYLNAVRRHADYGYKHGRDLSDGGYWDNWSATKHAPDERKTMIENASASRIFWLLAPYDDIEQLQFKVLDALKVGDTQTALNYYQQVLASDSSVMPTVIPVVPVSVPAPQTWKTTTTAPPKNWTQKGFDDANWQSAAGAFGGKMDGGPQISSPWDGSDIWLRRSFKVDKLSAAELNQLVLRQYHDDGVEVYINGVLAYENAGATHEYDNVAMSAAARAAIVVGGDNILAVHCHDGGGDKHVDVGVYRLIPLG